MLYLGRHEESLKWIQKATRLNPHYPGWYATVLATGYYMTKQYVKAIDILVSQDDRNFIDLRILAASHGMLGQLDDAREQANKILAINPQFNLESLRPRLPYVNGSDIEHYIDGLRKAGLK